MTTDEPAPAAMDRTAFPGRVFLSYSSKDKSVAAEVRSLLTALGHEVWFDRLIEYGQTDHWPEIVRAIDECDTYLILVSGASLHSPHVFREWLRAIGEEQAHAELKGAEYQNIMGPYPWPTRRTNVRAVILEDTQGDLGDFASTWRQLPQAPDRGEPQDTVEKAAWNAAAALSPQGESLGVSLADAVEDLKAAVDSSLACADVTERDRVIRERTLPAIARVWLAEASILPGPGDLDLKALGQWHPPHDAAIWASWPLVRDLTLGILDNDSPVALEAVREFEDLGVASISEALAALPRRQQTDVALDPGRYYLKISDHRLSSTVPDNLSRWIYRTWLDSHRFGATFLIGPEAVHTGREEVRLDVRGIAAEAAAIAGLDEQGEAEVESFFRALVRGNLGQRLEAPPSPTRDRRVGDEEMDELRARLLLLAHRANKTFVERHQQLETPISLDSWMTPVELNGQQVDELTGLIDSACKLLSRWVTETAAGGTFARTLGSKALGEALETLRGDLTGSASGPYDAPHPGGEQRLCLSAESVQWLADIFWHSLVHDIPVYPTASELVIQASLVHDSSGSDDLGVTRPPARAGYRQVWPSRRVEKLGDAVTEALELPWRSNPSCRALFRELAITLRNQFLRQQGTPPIPVGGGTPQAALVVSFAFDLELESALATTGDGVYHVAFPLVEVGEESTWGDWRWAVATFKGPGGGRRVHEEILERLRVPQTWQFLANVPDESSLHGPLILKVSGAPLLNLRDVPAPKSTAYAGSKADSLRQQVKAQRAAHPAVRYFLPLAMGDYDNMQFLLIDLITNSLEQKLKDKLGYAAMPGWLLNQLSNPERHWLGIGISEQDWNVRMQLFVHASRANQASIGALFPDEQPGREAFLRSCGIQPVTGSLETLASLLEERSRRNGDIR